MRRLAVTLGCALGLMGWGEAKAMAAAQTMSGCGLGYLLLSKNSPSRLAQIFGATTNHTFGTQTFGITSGTSGCNQDGTLVAGKEAVAYAEVNFESLRQDIADGQGEYLESFMAVLGTPADKRHALAQFLQTQYSMLFASPRTTPDEMLQTLNSLFAEHPEFIG